MATKVRPTDTRRHRSTASTPQPARSRNSSSSNSATGPPKCSSTAHDTIYFINKAVWRLPVTADKFPVKPFLPYNNTLYYGLTINPVNSEVYIADAIDYVQNGVVLRYSPDGELLDEFYVGIIPGAFCWR